MIHVPKSFDSKFRFILVAAARAKQIQSGAPPKLESKSRKPAVIAVQECEHDLIPFDFVEEE